MQRREERYNRKGRAKHQLYTGKEKPRESSCHPDKSQEALLKHGMGNRKKSECLFSVVRSETI
jgi:hypothetical protein